MNPEMRDCNAWILCRSTRLHGKYYYFNPATGEAVWNLNDMERKMVHPPNFTHSNFTHSDKWHAYPEPDCPPEDTFNPWVYQPDYRGFPQASPPFGQAIFPKYVPNPMLPPSMPWGMPSMPQTVYMPQMMSTFNPMPHSWANYRGNQKHFMHERTSFPNNPYYVQKVPNFNQGPNRQVFGMKPKPNNFPMFSQMSNQNRDIMNKRSHTVTESGNDKEPLFKRLRSQIDLQNENLFRPNNNLKGAQSFESLLGENVSKPTKIPSFQPKSNCAQHCDCCILSRSNENLKQSSQWSKSHGNLTMIDKPKEDILKPTKMQRATSLESLLNPPSEVSSNFSVENSFVFPLNKADSKTSSAKSSTLVKKVQNSTVSQSGLDKKIQSESSDSKLSETDLRYILMARRRKSSVTELKETSKQDHIEVKKIKTSYSDTNKSCGESFPKKRVTFDLGVEDMADENPEVDATQDPGMAVEPVTEEEPKGCYVVADVDAMLAEFELIENYVKSEENFFLLIPAHISHEIESICVDLSAPRSHLLAARQISRHIARQAGDNQSRIVVQREDPEAGSGETDDPTLNCCLKAYDEGYTSILITNNQDLINKAVSYELECYTTEDVKEYMGLPKPEVSFDIQKVGNTENGITSDNGEPSRNKLFKNTNRVTDEEDTVPMNKSRRNFYLEATNQFFLKKNEEQKSMDDDRVQMINKLKQVQVNDRNPFLDNDDDLLEDTQRKIENLNLQEEIKIQKSQTIAVKKKLEEKENSVSKNFEAKEDCYTAKKKIKSINVYNLDGLLKSFSIKSKDMEEIIMVRMDEYVCIFCQIMEYIFEDIVKDAPCKIPEDNTKSLVQNQLTLLREVVTDHRTARSLVDKLSAVMDKAFVFIPEKTDNKVKGRLKLQMAPNEFVKMFACGTLLVQVLRSIADDETLAEGEALLEQLERSLSQWDEAPTPITPATPAIATAEEPRPEYVKQRSEIKEYLAKHYPHAHGNNADDTELPADRQKAKPEVTEKVKVKVISTFGRNLGRLKLNPGKPIQLCKNKSNEDKENHDNKERNVNKDSESKIKNANHNNKTKTMRKLEFEKLKEIDVEKRENDDKELTEMLEQMLKKQPLTKRYDLKSIIINKDDNNAEIVKTDNNAKINPNKGLKIKNARKTESEPKIMIIDNKVTNFPPKQIINEPNNNAVDINKISYDLDVLDYSEETVEEKEESTIDDSSSNRLVIVESDHCNDVTTTNHELNDSSPNNEQNNDASKDSDSGNENNEESVHNDVDNENCDSGIESYQAYSLVQLFLFNLSKTFIIIKQFIEGSIVNLSNGIDEDSLDVMNLKVVNAHDALMKIINNLNLIIDRESNPESALKPMLLKGGTEAKTDKRIIKYKRVVSKCLSQARVLQRSLQILERIAHKDLLMRDLSDVSDNYSNLFE